MAAGSRSDSAGVRRTLHRIGAFHLPKQDQHDHGELSHGVRQIAHTHTPPRQVGNHVQGVAHGGSNISSEVVWRNGNGSEIMQTADGCPVLLPYTEYEHDSMSRLFPLDPGNIPIKNERHYPNDQAVIDDLPVIQGWTYPESKKLGIPDNL